jgi:Fe-S cluster biogenesis protein NfuA
MSIDLQSVVISKTAEGRWLAHHVPSGRKIEADSMELAQEGMRDALGLNVEGKFEEPVTSSRFSGVAQSIALFLEGPVSEALAFHSGFARLDAYEAGVAHIRLGGGCQGCPSSQITLFNGVRSQLQNRFGEDVIMDVVPSLD